MDTIAKGYHADRRTPPSVSIHRGGHTVELAGSPDLSGEIIATVKVGPLRVASLRIELGQVDAVRRFLVELDAFNRGRD